MTASIMPTLAFAVMSGMMCPSDPEAEKSEQVAIDHSISVICDDGETYERRADAIKSLADYAKLTDAQLESLHGVFGAERTFEQLLLFRPLGRLGNEDSLRLLLAQQTRWKWYKYTLTLNAAIYSLSKRLDIDVWDQLHPFYRKLWTDQRLVRPTGRKLESIESP